MTGADACWPPFELEALSGWLRASLEGRQAGDVENFVAENQGAIMRWRLLTVLGPEGRGPGSWEAAREWLLSQTEALDVFLSSGDVEKGRWKEALQLLYEIITEDPEATTGVRLRLAVAVSLTFSAPTRAFEIFSDSGPVDAMARYFAFCVWLESGELYPTFRELTAWQMRYVVGCWAQDDELFWLRENIGPSCTRPTVGHTAVKLVPYRDRNAQGVSCQDQKGYYGGRRITPQLLKEVGAVCGGISKFSSAACQAFGVPAMPIGQPGHCAFVWQVDQGRWELGNNCGGWGGSGQHAGVHITWGRQAWLVQLMEHAQQDLGSYTLSECLRLVAPFVGDRPARMHVIASAKRACPYNFAVWQELAACLDCGCPGLGSEEAWAGEALRAAAVEELHQCPEAVHHLYTAADKGRAARRPGESEGFTVEVKEWGWLEPLDAPLLAAEWGAGDKWADVRGYVAVGIRRGTRMQVRNETMGSDPAPGASKVLRVAYGAAAGAPTAGLPKESPLQDDEESFVVEVTEKTWLEPLGARVLAAVYGDGNIWVDVRGRVEAKIAEGGSFLVLNDAMGCDPCPGKLKTLRITYGLG